MLFLGSSLPMCCVFFFFNDTATTEIYTLSLHDALPISQPQAQLHVWRGQGRRGEPHGGRDAVQLRPLACCAGYRDRKSTRLNSSHLVISYAAFCLKKKKTSRTTASDRSAAEQRPSTPST